MLPHAFLPLKGEYNGECNRKVCRNVEATWYNYETKACYCRDCAVKINSLNRKDAMDKYGHDQCRNLMGHPTEQKELFGEART